MASRPEMFGLTSVRKLAFDAANLAEGCGDGATRVARYVQIAMDRQRGRVAAPRKELGLRLEDYASLLRVTSVRQMLQPFCETQRVRNTRR